MDWRLEEMNQANRHAPKANTAIPAAWPCIKSYGWDFTTQKLCDFSHENGDFP